LTTDKLQNHKMIQLKNVIEWNEVDKKLKYNDAVYQNKIAAQLQSLFINLL